MKNIKDTVERYTSAWNEKTAAEVKNAFAQILADGITYQDRQTFLVTRIDVSRLSPTLPVPKTFF